MDSVDGNAIGGLLIDVFGAEMTAAGSTCVTCEASRPVAELVVYRQSPGAVVRCRTCGAVLMVLVTRNDITSVDLSGLASLADRNRPDENNERTTMPDDQSMSMGQPDEGPMMMGQPDEGPMMMGQQDEDPMMMGQQDDQSG
jgi:Family of unknown function (DUF6510)